MVLRRGVCVLCKSHHMATTGKSLLVWISTAMSLISRYPGRQQMQDFAEMTIFWDLHQKLGCPVHIFRMAIPVLNHTLEENSVAYTPFLRNFISHLHKNVCVNKGLSCPAHWWLNYSDWFLFNSIIQIWTFVWSHYPYCDIIEWQVTLHNWSHYMTKVWSKRPFPKVYELKFPLGHLDLCETIRNCTSCDPPNTIGEWHDEITLWVWMNPLYNKGHRVWSINAITCHKHIGPSLLHMTPKGVLVCLLCQRTVLLNFRSNM